jgi:hypothetical protein
MRVAWERHMALGSVHPSRVHRVTEELPNRPLCGYGVPPLGEVASVIYRGDQVPEHFEDCKICVALAASGVVPEELAA